MTDEELIARLRGWAKDIREGSTAIWAMDQDVKQAADRIEALVKERDALKRLSGAQSQMLDAEEARAEQLEAALRWYSDDPSSQGDVARAALKGDDHD